MLVMALFTLVLGFQVGHSQPQKVIQTAGTSRILPPPPTLPTLRLSLPPSALCTPLAVLGKHNPPHFSPRGFLTPPILTPRKPPIPLSRWLMAQQVSAEVLLYTCP